DRVELPAREFELTPVRQSLRIEDAPPRRVVPAGDADAQVCRAPMSRVLHADLSRAAIDSVSRYGGHIPFVIHGNDRAATRYARNAEWRNHAVQEQGATAEVRGAAGRGQDQARDLRGMESLDRRQGPAGANPSQAGERPKEDDAEEGHGKAHEQIPKEEVTPT